MPVGNDKLWIIGDYFVGSTIQQFLKRPYNESYSRTNMEVQTFHPNNTREDSDNPLSRILNVLLSAMRSKAFLPKLMVIILEDDIIKYTRYDDYGVTALYGQLIDYLATEVRKLIDEFKQKFLPAKTSREDYPQVLWVLPTTHMFYHSNKNTLRKKFAGEMEIQLRFQPYMHAVKLSKIWAGVGNHNLVGRYDHRMTVMGIAGFYKDLDEIVRLYNEDFVALTKRRDYRCRSDEVNNNEWPPRRSEEGVRRPAAEGRFHTATRVTQTACANNHWHSWRPHVRKPAPGDRFLLPRCSNKFSKN